MFFRRCEKIKRSCEKNLRKNKIVTKKATMINDNGWVPGYCALPVSQYWLTLQHKHRLMDQRQTLDSSDQSLAPTNTHTSTWPIIDRVDASGKCIIYYDRNRDPRLLAQNADEECD